MTISIDGLNENLGWQRLAVSVLRSHNLVEESAAKRALEAIETLEAFNELARKPTDEYNSKL